jgi:hypothetical protein
VATFARNTQRIELRRLPSTEELRKAMGKGNRLCEGRMRLPQLLE